MKPKIIYICISLSSFVKKDIELLSKKFEVITFQQNWGNKKKTPLLFLQQFFFLITNLYQCKGVFVMFGGYWSFLPAVLGKIFRKKVFILLGGTDCVSFPSINYGSLRKPILKIFIGWSYSLAYKLLPNHDSLVFYNEKYFKEAIHKNHGFKYFFPNLKTPFEIIYNGFDPDFCSENITTKVPNSFIMIAVINNEMRLKLKGFDVLLNLAIHNPDCSFTLVGINQLLIPKLGVIPSNLKLFPFLNQNDFKKYLVESEYIMQLSISEGFPNALCEGMLCNCIPIGTHVGAIPFIIENTGFIFDEYNYDLINQLFAKIKTTPNIIKKELGIKAKSRVINNFSLKQRGDKFMNQFNNLK